MKENVTIHLSEIEIFPIKPCRGLLGFASFILNGHFYAGNIGIHSRPNGDLRLVFPEVALPNGKRIPCFHPITKEAGALALQEIFKKYQSIMKGAASA